MRSEESLTYDEVNSWHSDALKLYCRQWGLNVSGRKQELVARAFAALEMRIPLQPTAEERIATTANEKARLLDLGSGSSLPDPSTLKHWLRESDAITSWPPIFLSDITVFLMEDHPGKEVALHERVLRRRRPFTNPVGLKKFTGIPYQLHRSSVCLKPTVLIP